MAIPTCELYAGKEHDANPPAAVGRFLLKWWSDHSGEQMRSGPTNLCRPCYDSKAAEFRELARTRPGDNCVEVIQRYAGGLRLPVHAGRCARR